MVALANDAPPAEMSLEAWGDLPEDSEGELVDGRLVEDEEVGILHDHVAGWIVRIIGIWLAGNGIVGTAETRFAPTPRRGRKPDAYVYFPGRRGTAHGLVKVPPDIMVEVVSPRPQDSRRDRVEKLADYAAFGVHFYWIVDPQARTFEIFELGADGRYVHALGAADGRIERVPGCDGLVVDLDALWAEVDRLLPEAE